jgi:hypothetical protein
MFESSQNKTTVENRRPPDYLLLIAVNQSSFCLAILSTKLQSTQQNPQKAKKKSNKLTIPITFGKK